jgi:hypothetical protein
MDVEVGIDRLDRQKDVAIMLVGLVRMNTTLDADFGGASLDRILTLLENFFVAAIERVDRIVLVTREPAERAADITDIGEIDISTDDVTDIVSAIFAARQISSARGMASVIG